MAKGTSSMRELGPRPTCFLPGCLAAWALVGCAHTVPLPATNPKPRSTLAPAAQCAAAAAPLYCPAGCELQAQTVKSCLHVCSYDCLAYSVGGGAYWQVPKKWCWCRCGAGALRRRHRSALGVGGTEWSGAEPAAAMTIPWIDVAHLLLAMASGGPPRGRETR